ncbi:MAG: YIP1 family protein, partial [Bacteroidota bacterium]
LYAALISWTGKWLGGEAGTLSILRILAYAMLPSIVAFVFLIPQIAVHGIELFKKEGHVAGGGWLSNVMMFSSLIIQTVLSIWTAVLAIVGISVVQNFSMGKAIVNAILPALVIGIPLVLFIFIVMSV